MRADGKKLRHIDPMYTVAAHIMDRRSDAMNMTTVNIPLEPIQKFIKEQKEKGIAISHLAMVTAAYIRTVNDYPLLNHFVVNKKIYARNELSVSMVVLKAGHWDHGDMAKAYFDRDDTVFQVNDKMNAFIDEARNNSENSGMTKFLNAILAVPGVLTVGIKIFKFMDKYGLLPKSLLKVSPFHNSVAISNLASIRTNHIYHHCYDFGTTSMFLVMGNAREVPKRKNGEIVFEHCMPIGVTMDERICSGAYVAAAFKKFRSYLKNPELLTVPPTTHGEDVEL